MEKVILDANILVAPFTLRFNLDLELERLLGTFEGLVCAATLGELDRLNEKVVVKRSAASLARKYRRVDTKYQGDDAILEAGRRYGAVVATADHRLQRRALGLGLRVIGIRGGKKLGWVSAEVR